MKLSTTLKVIAACAHICWATAAFAQHDGHQATTATSVYAGEQLRTIKALSPNDITGLQNGAGMALAKAAELNGYPGPAHVLELKTQLKLTVQQRSATEALMAAHKTQARALGAQVIQAEHALDAAFALKTADAAVVTDLTKRIGELQATLRAEHLQTHLTQTAMLTPEQIANYQMLRGYTQAAQSPTYLH